MSVWVTSLVTTHEVINLLLEKYKVDSAAENFSLFIIRDNGEQKRLKENEYPLITRIMLGPHEDVAKLFLVDAKKTDEIRYKSNILHIPWQYFYKSMLIILSLFLL